MIDGPVIGGLIDRNHIPADIEVIDIHGSNIAPGFIDLQVNGGGGFLFNDNPTEERIKAISAAHRRFGTTTILPTITSTSTETMLRAIASVKSVMQDRDSGILGLHLEGPFISVQKAGIHDRQQIRPIVMEELELLIAKGQDTIKVLTVAPEVVGRKIIEFLLKNQIALSAGHTNADYDRSMQFFEWGGIGVTHLFNAMSELGTRDPGLVGASLDSIKTWAGIIADGLHVHSASIRIAKRLKGDRLYLVTDAMPPMGTNISSFEFAGMEITCENGKCTTPDGKLAGSAVSMASAVNNCVYNVGIDLAEALRMASTYPARFIGVGHFLGRVKLGYRADLVIFSNQITVQGVTSYGVYESFT